MKVLETGHAGSTGSILSPFLPEAGHEVFGLEAGTVSDTLRSPSQDANR